MATELKGKAPSDCIVAGCTCYTPAALNVIAQEMIEHQKCKIALHEKQKLIEERFVTFDANHGIAWWQEPTTIAGGLVISASIATLATFWLIKDK